MATPKQKTVSVKWAVNVKYGGKRYRAGDPAEIKQEDLDALKADGLIHEDMGDIVADDSAREDEEAPDGNASD